MKKAIFITLIVLTSFTLATYSQSNQGIISGAVSESGGKKLEMAASTTLLNAKDSSVVSRGSTDSSGSFRFENLPDGKYILSISAVNYKTIYSAVPEITENRSNIYLKTVKLIPTSGLLEGVTVSAIKPTIQHKAGMMIVNVANSPVNTGLTALELLEKSPGVSVNNDGKISLKGKQGVMILIDGKPTYMSETDLTTFLKNMQSSSIEQIEIMTNPSAKYDASGNSGIINIRTKKGIVKGMNGTANISYSQGIYPRLNGGINLNYRNDKLNIFGGYNAGYAERLNTLTISRNFYNIDKHTLTGSADQVSKLFSTNEYNNIKLGADYNISRKDIVGILINGSLGDNKNTPGGNMNVRDAAGEILYKLKSVSKSHKKSINISTNINYKHSFDTAGRELSADLDYAHYSTRDHSQLTTQGYNTSDHISGNPLILKGYIPSDINIYSAKIDYIHPLKSGIKLESGIKSSIVKSDNEVSYLRNTGAEWSVDDRSNHFIYEENINAAYLIASKTFRKLEVSAGLRAENTHSRGHQFNNDSIVDRHYTNLFPNLGLKYEVDKKNEFDISYSRRVLRPDYQDLNPFIFFIDSLTYEQGNSYLQPQFSNNFELSHTFNKFLTTTLNYTQTDDIITGLLKQETEKKLTYQTKDNLSSMKQLGIAVTVSTPINKWWNTNIFVNVYNNKYKGIYQGDEIAVSISSVSLNISNSFKLGKGWNAELSGWYLTKIADGLLVANKMGSASAGISKQVLNKQGMLKIGIRDIFRTDQFSGYARYSDVNVYVKSAKDSRQVSVSFNYRFGKKNIASARKKSAGALDEQNRIKS